MFLRCATSEVAQGSCRTQRKAQSTKLDQNIGKYCVAGSTHDAFAFGERGTYVQELGDLWFHLRGMREGSYFSFTNRQRDAEFEA